VLCMPEVGRLCGVFFLTKSCVLICFSRSPLASEAWQQRHARCHFGALCSPGLQP